MRKIIFRKEKLIARLTAEGRMHLIDDEKMAVIDNIDGKTATPNIWKKSLYDDDDAYICTTDDGRQFAIKLTDCDDISE